MFVAIPLTLFVFKLSKHFVLYHWRVGASFSGSLAACVAGLGLSHVIGRAMLTGCENVGVGFFRTPKMASTRGLVRALQDVREELLFMVALVLGAGAVLLRDDGGLLDVQLWSAMLAVQAVPYAAAGLLSAISVMPGLTRRLVPRVHGSLAQPIS